MAVINQDFTGTNGTFLTALDSDWAFQTGAPAYAVIQNNELELQAYTTIVAYNSTSSEDLSEIIILPTATNRASGVGPSINVTATESGQYFYLDNQDAEGTYHTTISVFDNGAWITSTVITAGTYLVADAHTLKIEETANDGTDVTFTCSVDGATIGTFTATGAASTAGNDGIYSYRNNFASPSIVSNFSSGPLVDSFLIDSSPSSIKPGDTGLEIDVSGAAVTPTTGNTVVRLGGASGLVLSSTVAAGTITIAAPAHTTMPNLRYHSTGHEVYVTINAETNSVVIPFLPPSGYGFVDLTSISNSDITDPANPIAVLDQLEYETAASPFTVSINNGGVITLVGSGDTSASSFDVRAFDNDDSTWGAFASQTGSVISELAPPLINTGGSTTLTLIEGDTYADPAWTWSDDTSSGNAVVWTGTVDDTEAGTYVRTATATNAIDTVTVDLIITVSALLPDADPVITTTGGTSITILEDSTFSDPSWTWGDSLRSDQPVVWDALPAVSTDSPGTYVRTGRAFNEVGSSSATYTVTVSSVPVLTPVSFLSTVDRRARTSIDRMKVVCVCNIEDALIPGNIGTSDEYGRVLAYFEEWGGMDITKIYPVDFSDSGAVVNATAWDLWYGDFAEYCYDLAAAGNLDAICCSPEIPLRWTATGTSIEVIIAGAVKCWSYYLGTGNTLISAVVADDVTNSPNDPSNYLNANNYSQVLFANGDDVYTYCNPTDTTRIGYADYVTPERVPFTDIRRMYPNWRIGFKTQVGELTPITEASIRTMVRNSKLNKLSAAEHRQSPMVFDGMQRISTGSVPSFLTVGNAVLPHKMFSERGFAQLKLGYSDYSSGESAMNALDAAVTGSDYAGDEAVNTNIAFRVATSADGGAADTVDMSGQYSSSAGIRSFAHWNAYNSNSFPMDCFINIGGALHNMDSSSRTDRWCDGTSSSVYNVLPGAVHYNQTSNGYLGMSAWIANGGSAAVGSVSEPTAANVNEGGAFAQNLLRGMTVAEASFWTNQKNFATVWGDGLAQPFYKESLTMRPSLVRFKTALMPIFNTFNPAQQGMGIGFSSDPIATLVGDSTGAGVFSPAVEGRVQLSEYDATLPDIAHLDFPTSYDVFSGQENSIRLLLQSATWPYGDSISYSIDGGVPVVLQAADVVAVGQVGTTGVYSYTHPAANTGFTRIHGISNQVNTGDLFTDTAHGLANETRVYTSGSGRATGSSEIASYSPYYVVSANTNDFQLSTLKGGSATVVSSDINNVYWYKYHTIEITVDINLLLGAVVSAGAGTRVIISNEIIT